MRIVNSWKSTNKQSDKVHMVLRIGKVTVFELYLDVSKKEFRVMLMNIGVKNE